MSEFVGLTPTMEVKLHNPFAGKKYPNEGYITAIIDTGYDRFVVVPRGVFDALSHAEAKTEKERLIMANGYSVETEGAYGSFTAQGNSLEAQGLIETFEGADQVLLGVEALRRTRTLLDYCRGTLSIDPCTRPSPR